MEMFAPGTHLLIDFWGAHHAQDLHAIEAAFRDAIIACDAHLLNIQLHSFGEGAGVTGVATLAESHMSIHTWPELDYMAIDVFMCGDANPHNALAVLKACFNPRDVIITEYKRGIHPSIIQLA